MIFVIDLLIGLFITDFDRIASCFLSVRLSFVIASYVSLRFSFVITFDVFSSICIFIHVTSLTSFLGLRFHILDFLLFFIVFLHCLWCRIRNGLIFGNLGLDHFGFRQVDEHFEFQTLIFDFNVLIAHSLRLVALIFRLNSYSFIFNIPATSEYAVFSF